MFVYNCNMQLIQLFQPPGLLFQWLGLCLYVNQRFMISKKCGWVFVYVAATFLARFEDYQELYIMRGIVSFSRIVFLAEVCHGMTTIVILFQQYSAYSLVWGIGLQNDIVKSGRFKTGEEKYQFIPLKTLHVL